MFVALSAVFGGSGCADEGEPLTAPPAPDPGPTLDYETAIQPLWDTRCGPVCHGMNGNGGLDLRLGRSHDSLVGTVSPTYGAPRVVPGDPGSSVLFDKITGGGRFGPRMPADGSTLTARQIQVVEQWILAGAPDGAFPAPPSPARVLP